MFIEIEDTIPLQSLINELLARKSDGYSTVTMHEGSEPYEPEGCEGTIDYHPYGKLKLEMGNSNNDNPSIYIASRTKHAPKWLALRQSGVNIISTWIDEYEPGASTDLADLMQRCIAEATLADYFILYNEPEEYLKVALIECGAAMGAGNQIIVVGHSNSSTGKTFLAHRNVTQVATIEDALQIINQK